LSRTYKSISVVGGRRSSAEKQAVWIFRSSRNASDTARSWSRFHCSF